MVRNCNAKESKTRNNLISSYWNIVKTCNAKDSKTLI